MTNLKAIFVGLLSLSIAPGQEATWKQTCAQAKKLALPTGDQPGNRQKAVLSGCDSIALYYGFDQPSDFVKARHCAYLEIEQNNEGVFGGRAMLMMIYANGKGVARNLDIAIKLACEVGSAADPAAEVIGRVAHLQRLKTTRGAFDFCDDITSSYMIGACVSLRDEFPKVKWRRRLNAVTTRWAPEHKRAFQGLQSALEAFVKERARNEVDLSGQLRAFFVLREESKLRDQFVGALERFEQGKLPLASRASPKPRQCWR